MIIWAMIVRVVPAIDPAETKPRTLPNASINPITTIFFLGTPRHSSDHNPFFGDEPPTVPYGEEDKVKESVTESHEHRNKVAVVAHGDEHDLVRDPVSDREEGTERESGEDDHTLARNFVRPTESAPRVVILLGEVLVVHVQKRLLLFGKLHPRTVLVIVTQRHWCVDIVVFTVKVWWEGKKKRRRRKRGRARGGNGSKETRKAEHEISVRRTLPQKNLREIRLRPDFGHRPFRFRVSSVKAEETLSAKGK